MFSADRYRAAHARANQHPITASAEQYDGPQLAFLRLPGRPASAESMEQLLARWTTRGFLVVTATTDTLAAGDPQFLLHRRAAAVFTPAAHFDQHRRLHRTLCARKLPHLRLSVGPASGGPLVTAWLVPAPRTGQLTATGFQLPYELPPAAVNAWLDHLAGQLQEAFTDADRIFVQAPGGSDAPATGYHRMWRGDTALPGATPAQRLLTWLRTHPRYDLGPDGAVVPPDAPTPDPAPWQWLLPRNPTSWANSVTRGTTNYELRGGPEHYPA